MEKLFVVAFTVLVCLSFCQGQAGEEPTEFACYVCTNEDGATACPPGLQGTCAGVEKCHVKPVGKDFVGYNWIRGCGCDEAAGQECCSSSLCNVGNLASARTISLHLAVITAAVAFFMNL